MADLNLISSTEQFIPVDTKIATVPLVGAGDWLRIHNAGSVPVKYNIGDVDVTMNGVAEFSGSNAKIELGTSIAPFATAAAYSATMRIRNLVPLANMGSILNIFKAYDGGGDGIAWRVLTDGTIQPSHWASTTLSYYDTDAGVYPDDFDWHTLQFIYNGTNMVVGLDGTQIKDAAITIHGDIGSTATLGYFSGSGFAAYMEMDYLYIYSGTKTLAQLVAKDATNLVASYDFVEDASDGTNSNNGTLTNSTVQSLGKTVLPGEYVDVALEDGNPNTGKSHICFRCASSSTDISIEEGRLRKK